MLEVESFDRMPISASTVMLSIPSFQHARIAKDAHAVDTHSRRPRIHGMRRAGLPSLHII